MPRFAGMLVLLTLLAPAALAAPDAPLPDAAAAPALDAAAEQAQQAGRALAQSASRAADATGDGLAALGSGAAALASAIGSGLLATARLAGAALSALGSLVAAIGALLAGALAGVGRFVAAHPRESAYATTGVAGVAGAYSLAKRLWALLFLPLYTRLAPSEMLDNKVRAAVYEHVKARPGAHPSAIAAALDIGWGTVVYHLARLEESSLVTSRSAHHRKCFFAVGSELGIQERTAVAAISTDKARAIVDALRESPGISQKDLAERLGMSQALASWHVKRLVASGVVLATRSGRSNALHVAEHVPRSTPAAVVAA